MADHGQGWRPHDTLAARLVLLRRELGLSQREAADRSGLTFGEWQGLENEDRHPRGVDVKIKRIAAAFGVDREWLIFGGPLQDPDDWGGDGPPHASASPTAAPTFTAPTAPQRSHRRSRRNVPAFASAELIELPRLDSNQQPAGHPLPLGRMAAFVRSLPILGRAA